ncbi:hypothetical protein DAPPUDRAFT_239135 [Daphnia pulex]|uniref:Secreted protein n=1 Tax=Daphnia pulex TaxID=6669 RepID=E9G8F5_DAPPU|nr:hypothetical protein DAPPUDRAFT_239135 [Daphnia pulex]|eukprot:EFX84282.1 hypothetical protein DAPPUDRAFT_239135 [Daphnia pulex]
MWKHAVSLWNRVVLARIFLSQRWLLCMTNVLLHPYLPDVSSSSFCFIASYTKVMQRKRRDDGHQNIFAEVTDVSDYLQLLWHSISGEHQHSYFSSFSSIVYQLHNHISQLEIGCKTTAD